MSESVTPPGYSFTFALNRLHSVLSEMTTAVYEGSDDDRKIALTHLLDAWGHIVDVAESLSDSHSGGASESVAP